MPDITPFEYDSQLVVDSRIIAEELGIQHDNFIQNIYAYQTDIEQAFGIVLFQTEKLKGPGRPKRFALLNENQATFLMTLSENTSQVIQCKLKLVVGFATAKELLRAKSNTSYWYKRIGLAMSDTEKPLEAGYFCVYVEMMRFFSELEMRLGYVVDDKNLITDEYIVPDISIGISFNNWLRSDDEIAYLTRKEFLGSGEIVDFRKPSPKVPNGGINRYEILEYNHIYPIESHGKNNSKPSNSYPNKYKSIFHHYLEEYYIPDKCFKYIKDRDPQGIENLKIIISVMPDKTRNSLSNTLVGRFIGNLLPAA
ncbi:MAG: Rha family transcriptional regulator [Nostoc sp. EfeVER01]|uniref:Rha family transcriptional regulator n=1 Tax=Nostoc sp. EfeVER01 TaxID=3075406 RepID=UPI00391896AA